MSVKSHLRFQAQRIARAQAAWLDAELRAGAEEIVPERHASSGAI